MSLVSVEELEAFMGRDFSTQEEIQAQAILDNVEALVESALNGISLTLVENDIIKTQADGHGMIELISKPIHDIVSITDVNGDEIANYEFDGMACIYNLFPLQVVTITLNHGYVTLPADIRTIILGAASRFMNNPSGLRQETVGAISVTYPSVAGEAGTINFSALEKRVIAKYADYNRSMRTAVTRRRIAGMPVLTIDNDVD